MSPDKLEEWTQMMTAPLPGEPESVPTGPSEAELAEDGASFMAFMAQHKANTGKG